jgi:Xaa-Pro aminopeptidase
MKTVPERIDALRALMSNHGLSHYVVPSADEHLNEYLPPWHQRRAWISGFTGSAGDVLLGTTPEETWLFTDGRYHLQAARELAGSGIGLQKVGAKGAKTLREVLAEIAAQRGKSCVVGFDPMVLPVASVEELGRALTERGATLRAVSPHLVDELWVDRPAPPQTSLILRPIESAGVGMGEKVKQLRGDLARRNAGGFATVKLDQIAWLTNLRSTDDIPHNPVFESYLWVDGETVTLFVHGASDRLPAGFESGVPGFRVLEYREFVPFLASLEACIVLADPDGVTQGVLDALTGNPNLKIVRGPSPIEEAKAVKNEAEQRGMAHANLMASAAQIRALLWLARETEAGRAVTERSFREVLEGHYRGIDGYRQLAFPTIAAAGDHGAIVHYGGADETELQRGELFLVDSGIQTDGGTTDATRTVAVGEPTSGQRHIYTRVLQAHIAGATQVFPEETPGGAIDALVRAPLWSERLQYDHGTGHGVGAFLNVHEGPFSLSEPKGRPSPTRGLKPGMITSIEPGYYRAGFGGVRLEGLYLVREEGPETDGRKWLGFTPLTWTPFDPRLIDEGLLDDRERGWVRSYHAECLERLGPHLSAEENAQLRRTLGETG